MFKQLKILYIEDSEDDTLLINQALYSICKNIFSKRVDTKDELKKMLKREKWSAILIDNTLPKLNAREAIELIKKMNVDAPLICMSGSDMYDIKEQSYKDGADAFILKDNLTEFAIIIEKILQRKKLP